MGSICNNNAYNFTHVFKTASGFIEDAPTLLDSSPYIIEEAHGPFQFRTRLPK